MLVAFSRTSSDLPKLGEVLRFQPFTRIYRPNKCELVRVQPDLFVGKDVGYDEPKCGE